MSDYFYFLVTGGAVRAAIEKISARRKEQIEARNAMVKELGATEYLAGCAGISGLKFPDGKVPQGWSKVRGYGDTFFPSGRTRDGKALRKRLLALPLDSCETFQEMVMGVKSFFAFAKLPRIRYMTYERIGDALVLCVPDIGQRSKEDEESGIGEGCKWQPPDAFCTPLKKSEYWALKEQAEAAKV